MDRCRGRFFFDRELNYSKFKKQLEEKPYVKLTDIFNLTNNGVKLPPMPLSKKNNYRKLTGSKLSIEVDPLDVNLNSVNPNQNLEPLPDLTKFCLQNNLPEKIYPDDLTVQAEPNEFIPTATEELQKLYTKETEIDESPEGEKIGTKKKIVIRIGKVCDSTGEKFNIIPPVGHVFVPQKSVRTESNGKAQDDNRLWKKYQYYLKKNKGSGPGSIESCIAVNSAMNLRGDEEMSTSNNDGFVVAEQHPTGDLPKLVLSEDPVTKELKERLKKRKRLEVRPESVEASGTPESFRYLARSFFAAFTHGQAHPKLKY